jgi:quercetin dioxygenase-like cupin family protein
MERSHVKYGWDQIEVEEVTQSLRRRTVSSDDLMLVLISVDEGHRVPSHVHVDNDQMTWVIDGALRMWVGSEDAEAVELAAGDVIHIPREVPHRVEALKDATVLDVFSPPRQDILNGASR